MRKNLPRWNLLSKFTLFVFVISVLPIIITGIISYRVSRSALRSNTTDYIREIVSDQRDYLELQLSQIENLVQNISRVETIINNVATEGTSQDAYTNLSTHAQIGYILNNYSNLDGLVSIDIFSNSNAHYHVGDTLNVSSIDTNLKDSIYEATLASTDRVVWLGIEENVNLSSSYSQVIAAATELNKISSDTFELEPIGLLIVNYSPDYLYDHLSQVGLGEGSYLLVVDAKGSIIYHPDKQKIGTQVDSYLMEQTGDSSGTLEMNIDGEQMFVVYEHIEMSDWLIYSFVPINILLEGTDTIEDTVLSSIVFLVVLIALAGGVFSRTVVTPIREITSRFRLAQMGEKGWFQKLPHIKQADEIGQLSQGFNAFVDNIVARQRTEAILHERTVELEEANQQLTIEIGERRKAEGEVLTLNATLELRVADRTAQLEEAVQELEAFSYSVSHDLRAPLRAINGFTEILQEEYSNTLDGEAREYLLRISSAGKKMNELIDGLLLLSRLGQDELMLEDVDIAVFAKEIFEELTQDESERIFETSFHSCESLLVDKHLIKILLTNLLSNAIKFTRDCPVAKIEFGIVEYQGEMVCYLSDNGTGFDMRFSDKLFGTFQRLHDDTYEGTGIGLAIVKRIIARHNGQIWVESEKGKGTTFYFSLNA